MLTTGWLCPKTAKRWGVDGKGTTFQMKSGWSSRTLGETHPWMYGGATTIAFDMPEEGGFAIVDREELAFFCEKHVRR